MAKKTDPNANTATAETSEPKDTPKKILVGIVSKFAETNVDLSSLLGSDLAQRVAAFYDSIKKSAVRGLPASERLANVEVLIREHYTNMPSLDSPAHGEWAYESMKLLQRKERIEREINEGGASRGKGGKANNASAS